MVDVTSGTEKLVRDSKPTNVIGKVQTAEYADYISHPAFEFDGSKAGIWVGKFESSGSTSEVKIIPNTASLMYINVGDIFTACQDVKNTYSLTGDSHMMKNTEWGAVAYLAESKYGRNGTKIEMNISNYLTGQGDYVTYTNQSTTGNIYGIYDMSGLLFEYVSGVLDSHLSNGSEYDFTKTDSKYYNVYTNYNESKKIKCDAVYETSTGVGASTGWHKDHSYFISSYNPIFLRGR